MGYIYLLFLVSVIPGIVVGSFITYKWFGPMLYKDKRAGCKYCLKEFPIFDKKGLKVRIAYGVHMIINCDGKGTGIQIGFCPICGRKLK